MVSRRKAVQGRDGVGAAQEPGGGIGLYMWSAHLPAADLYNRLKPHFIRMATSSSDRRRKHGEILSGMLLAGWGSLNDDGERCVSDDELRSILINADDEFRAQLLWNLENWTKQRDPGDEEEKPIEDDEGIVTKKGEKKRNRWFDLLPVFLTEVWPKHAKVRTARTSARLVDIALSQGDDLPKIAPLVSPIVSPVENEQIFIPQLRRSKNSLATRFPEPMLDLLFAILPENPARWPHGAAQALREIELADPRLRNDQRLVELRGRVGDG